jgi:LysM domain
MSTTATRTAATTRSAGDTDTRAPRSTTARTHRGPVSGRRTVADGACVVGRSDRPVLRIVADEGAPVVTRVAPSATHASPSHTPVVEGLLHPAAEPVEVRAVDLHDFFVAEYDGDDVALQVTRRAPSSVRLTRRGRLVVFTAGLAAVLGIAIAAATGSLADDRPEPTRVVTVQPGQTLWDVASRAAERTGGGDVRSMMTHLEAVNHLDSTTLQVGQTLHVPE